MKKEKISRVLLLRYPVRENLNFLFRLGFVVGFEMQAEIVHAAHVAVHHVLHRDYGAFTRVEGHRTDDRGWGSATLQYLDVRHFGEAQRLVADIGNADIVTNRRP